MRIYTQNLEGRLLLTFENILLSWWELVPVQEQKENTQKGSHTILLSKNISQSILAITNINPFIVCDQILCAVVLNTL